MVHRLVLLLLVGTTVVSGLFGQVPLASSPEAPVFRAVDRPMAFTIVDIRVEGVRNEEMARFIRKTSGLVVGQKVTVPGDPVFAEAIHALYRLDLFSDIKLIERDREGRGIFLDIQVREAPRLARLAFEGVPGRDEHRLRNVLPLYVDNRIRPGDVEQALRMVREHFRTSGYPLSDVELRKEAAGEGAVALTFVVERGPRVEIGDIRITGNRTIPDGRIRKQMKATRTGSWWRFWHKATFDPAGYQEDLRQIIELYREEGFLDARITRDTSYVVMKPSPMQIVEIELTEGPRYHIRDIVWEGNTLLSDAELNGMLGLHRGDVYNGKRIQETLDADPKGSDVTGRYLDRGYLRFEVQPRVEVVAGDSVDLHFDIKEGDVYTFGRVGIAGNRETREQVARRELVTIPGYPFSRAAIQQSLMRLVRLGYFTTESLAAGPEIRVDEAQKKVDLVYHVEDQTRNPLSLGGSYSGGLVLQLGFNLNNFALSKLFRPSRWQPLPTGDGQSLSLSLQTTGRNYQRFDFGFTEPWFRARPHPLGVSVSYARITNGFRSDTDDEGGLNSWSARVFHDRHPAANLTLSSGVRYRYYDNRGWSTTLPDGRSHELVLSESLTRSTLDHPTFPRHGSLVRLSVEVAPKISNVQYHKWRLRMGWSQPLSRRLDLGLSAEVGYIGSLTGRRVTFQRFLAGGSPFDAQGFDTFYGQDIIYLRGYPSRAIGPRLDGEAVGGQVLNHYAAELGWMAMQGPVLVARPYLFFEAANVWSGLDTWSPRNLFRSAGAGLRMNVPMLGLVELNYGYNLDRFAPIRSHDGSRKWRLQFTIGQRFGF